MCYSHYCTIAVSTSTLSELGLLRTHTICANYTSHKYIGIGIRNRVYLLLDKGPTGFVVGGYDYTGCVVGECDHTGCVVGECDHTGCVVRECDHTGGWV